MSNKIVICGHVDSGKSTLSGHFLLKMDVFSQEDFLSEERKAIENKMEMWKYAYLLDCLDEERESGKTKDWIDYNFKYNEKNYTLVDTPGHHNLIPKMLNGSFNTDVVLFNVSGKKSEFTKCLNDIEHIILFKCMGVKNLVVLLNKNDLYNESEADIMEVEIRSKLKKIGYKNFPILRVSGYLGDGLDKIMETIDKLDLTKEVIKNVITKSLQLKGLVLSSFISPGYKGILHGPDTEIEIEIDEMNKQFARKNDECILTIRFSEEQELKGKRFIIRNGNETVFLGTSN